MKLVADSLYSTDAFGGMRAFVGLDNYAAALGDPGIRAAAFVVRSFMRRRSLVADAGSG